MTGSPPPMRGKGISHSTNGGFPGITPAYAGKRHTRYSLSAHTEGSPPPMRGKVQPDNDIFYFVGITPAYAGKSLMIFLLGLLVLGSPPPMRGKDVGSWSPSGGWRIPPAYAGKSSDSVAGQCSVEDHPRLCGEKQLKSCYISW